MNALLNTGPRGDDLLVIAGRTYRSRLLTGTGKFKDFEETRLATEAAGAEIVTVAIRRTNLGQSPNEPNLLDVLPPDRYTILPNTAGCYTADDAVRTCRLARELLDQDPAQAARRLEAAFDLAPVNEAIAVALMRAYHRLRDADAVTQTLRRLSVNLEELGVDPAEETTVLAERLRRDLARRNPGPSTG